MAPSGCDFRLNIRFDLLTQRWEAPISNIRFVLNKNFIGS